MLAVRLTPRSAKDQIVGVIADAAGRPIVSIRIAAPPVDGAANKAIVRFLAKTLGTPKSAITITSGQTAREKRLLITGDPAEIIALLSRAIGP
ncbi:MAG: DUF167 domain-containing protein [Pikeienuella sp.]